MRKKRTQAEALSLLYLNRAEIATALGISYAQAYGLFFEAKKLEEQNGLYSVSAAKVNRRMVEKLIGCSFDKIAQQKAATN